jgi:hypothetical protein
MTNQTNSQFQAVIDECVPLLKKMAIGRCAVTVGGSRGKGINDNLSDIDFRLFCDDVIGDSGVYETEEWNAFSQVVDKWRAQGVYIDHCWIRKIGDIDAQVEAWLSGSVQPVEIAWTLWGYHLLTDLTNQVIIDDPSGVVALWQAQLTPYPQALQQSIIQKHMKSLNYWRSDYHYQNKVRRGDVVFLAGIAARLVHDMIQVLFAINETYYVGDGKNLHYVSTFAIKPENFAEQVNAILYPPQEADTLTKQYDAIMILIDEVVLLVAQMDESG